MMKWMKAILLVLIALSSATASMAWADHGRGGGGFRGGAHGDFHGGFHGGFRGPRVGFGLFVDPFPLFYGPAYYGPAYYPYYYPDVVVSPAPATVYVDPSAAVVAPGSGQPSQSNDWYYCHNPDGYYPSVRVCPSGWQRVPAQPPSDR
ncbi:hypothetical protein [Undibacterium sp.]|jgi:hypothetical protein|uniref:hypothetical protein n=1 Tax=Undibacterium sp. TaxID=1914977 RepID=UPI002BAC9629|nr:hypothetical protein [Undibacterium sp.]HTD06542.1 hypothetical protein [Undibacterium sp.]